MMSGVQDQLEIKFRLIDGSDIGPKSFPAATSVANLKESILALWPKVELFEARLEVLNENEMFHQGTIFNDVVNLLLYLSLFEANVFPEILLCGLSNHWLDLEMASLHMFVLDANKTKKQKKENGPRTVKDVKLISAGKILDNNMTVGDCRSPLCDIPGGVTIMHVVVQPPPLEKDKEFGVGIDIQITELPINEGQLVRCTFIINHVLKQVHVFIYL
ncbi:hypothetical protein TEA_012867 [Camellia sinensis var. sinensis]|uniref:UBL3-like ubiquitin domain-containing protein n=1 Tax=Camellia sinensis var. sinensis TaxID=542762 RepID=A0A4S4DPS6_CAMSN|nr:hypothetical protein TEA_012867 [Camellia sinensis var. sinensis]